jgi:hypothetical protein
MAQIIKHRRGAVTGVKELTTRNAEFIIASGSISDLQGPFIFIGSPNSTDEGVAGAFKSVSKIYQGSSAPTISSLSYGSILDGTPFYASGDKSLYILNNDGAGGNSKLDLTGNIEGNVISGLTINNLTGSTGTFSTFVSASALVVTGNTGLNGTLNVTGATTVSSIQASGMSTLNGGLTVSGTTSLNGDLLITGNTIQTGSISLTGDINLGGNITIGDSNTDSVTFGAEISSSIVPDVNNAFDLGSTTKSWKDLYVSGTAYIGTLNAGTVAFTSIGVNGDLTVSGNTFLGNDPNDKTIITGSVEVSGPVTASAFVGDGSQLTGIVSTLVVSGSDGVTSTSGSVNLKTEALTFSGQSSNGLNVGFDDAGNTVSYTLDQSIKTGATPTFNQMLLSAAGTGTTSAVRADRNLTINGTTDQVTVSGGTQNLQGDRTWTVSLPSTVNLGANSTITATTGSIGKIDSNIINVSTISGSSGSFIEMNATTASVNRLITTTGSFTNISADSGSFGSVTTTDLYVNGTLQVLGGSTTVFMSSSVVELDDNIIRLNAYSPFERYAGFEVMDSGSSGVSASLVWDSQNDYWLFVSSSGGSSKMIGTTSGTYGSEVSLTSGTIPLATGPNTIGDSLLTYSGTTLAFNTNKFTVDSSNGDTLVSGNFTLSASGGVDTNANTSAILFRNSNNVVGYVSTTETTDVLDGILGYNASNGALVFSTVVDGGTY